MFDRQTGLFLPDAVTRLGALEQMEVELEGGSGTAYAHWDEDCFGDELMTGFQDHSEHVLPVTIEVMKLFGHTVEERLPAKTPLDGLLRDAASVLFFRQDEAQALDLEHFEPTELMETIPHTPGVDDR